jgi:hypothetical protein
MHHIECVFPHPSCTEIVPFLEQMKQVETFVSQLTSIEEVVLELDSTPV